MAKQKQTSPKDLETTVEETFQSLQEFLTRNEFPVEIRENASNLKQLAAKHVSDKSKSDAKEHEELSSTYTELAESVREFIKKNEWLKSAGRTVLIRLLIKVFELILHM